MKVRIDRIKLVAEMTRQDLTQKELAERAGISRATVCYIKGGKSCSDDVGKKIAAALGVKLSTLLER